MKRAQPVKDDKDNIFNGYARQMGFSGLRRQAAQRQKEKSPGPGPGLSNPPINQREGA
jgi:hypothetical protein